MSKLKTMMTQAVEPVTDLHRETPRRKLLEKYVKTGFGALVFVGAFFLPKYLGFPVVAAYVVGGFGAFMMSQELVTRFIKIIPAAVAAIKGNGKNAP